MLKSKKAKIIFGALTVLCVLIASSIWVSLSLKSNSVDEFDYRLLAANDSASATMTQIDHIIETANQASTSEVYDNSNYYIYVIVPSDGAKATVLSEISPFLAGDDGFRSYIINNNRTIAETMPTGKIIPVVMSIAEINALPDMNTELGKADLIYIYSQSNAAYTGASGISENLYEFLHNYAFGSNKPLIMNFAGMPGDDDDVQDSGSSNVDTSSRMYYMLNTDFKNSWKRTYTTNVVDWEYDTAIEDIEGIIENYITNIRSTYSAYQVNNLTRPAGYATWADYWKRTGTAEPTLNVLYISGDSKASGYGWGGPINAVANWMVDPSGGRSATFSNAVEGDLPSVANVDTQPASGVTVDLLYTTDAAGNTVKKYDYIFIAPDTYKSFDIRQEVREELNKLSEDMNGLTYILFGTMPTESTSGGGGSTGGQVNLQIDTSTNFGKLVDLSVTTNGYAKRSNVLVIGTNWMSRLAANPAKNPKKVSDIVSLINKSRYRTYAGSGEGSGSGSVSTTAYRVLELQPSYPIDLILAEKQTGFNTNQSKYTNVGRSGTQYQTSKPRGNYYTIPANVLNTSEIDNYMPEDGVMTNEYYQWDLSKAKLAYALNLSADQIELVQMSSEEYITVKTDVSDSYDLIYIGGNMSALKNHQAYGFGMQQYLESGWLQYLSAFSMYTHTGEMKDIVGGRVTSNNPYSRTLMSGNDITYDRLMQLIAYIDAGMPIVFSNEIWSAYEDAKKDGYSNVYMDPDCNMFKLCKYAEDRKEKGFTSVYTDWQNRERYEKYNDYSVDYFYADYWVTPASAVQKISNPTGVYGSASKVTVFNDTLSQQLYETAYGPNTSIRPKYVIDTTAIPYVEGDKSTELTARTVTWKVELLNPIEGHTYQAVLLEDQDDNAVFSMASSERLTAASFAGTTANLSYTYPADDFGAFFWKILVQDTTTGAATSYSAITVFAKLEDQPKRQASVLEIMPMTQANCASGNPTSPDGHTFYLDKNYQQSSGNPYLYSSYGTAKAGEFGYAPLLHNPNAYGSDALNFNSNIIARATKTGNYQDLADMNMGKYMTTLSVNRYDSGEGHEDRDYNYMDLVSDKYDFSLDIMYMDDIEFYANAARKTTEAQREQYLALAEDAKKTYDAYLTPGTTEYEALKKVEDALREALIGIRDGRGYQTTYQGLNWDGTPATRWDGSPEIVDVNYASSEYKTYGIDQMLQSRDYFRFFYLNTAVYHGSNYCQSAYAVYYGAYKPYIDEHDKMVEAYRAYRHYNMMAYGPEEYLRMNYDVIVVGFLDDYAGDFQDFSQNATDDMLAFTEYVDEDGEDAGGSLLMTHDNMTYSYDANHARVLTDNMRGLMGMDPFGHFTEVAGTGTTGFPKYTSTDTNRYFLTNLSSNASVDLSMGAPAAGWDSSVNTWFSNNGKGAQGAGKFDLTGYSDIFNVYETNNGRTLRYTFAEFQIENAIKYNMQVQGPLNVTGTTKATQVNRGVVTTYPFYIASDLRISATHSQAFALDMEDKDVVVWYTLAADNVSTSGSSGGTNLDYSLMKENSSFYAASPKDGADSYYIYSVGNITYCGAGHALITGDERDNNDERRLFLNVLINMAKRGKSTPIEPELALYDPDGTEAPDGSVVKKDADGFYMDVISSNSYPEFGFGIKNLPEGVNVTDIMVYYDLDYDKLNPDNEYHANGNHVLLQLPDNILEILNTRTATGSGIYQLNRVDVPGLITLPSYFTPYGGEYTYIVIRAQLSDGSILYQRIRINITADMFDLT